MTRPVPRTAPPSQAMRAPGAQGAGGQHGAPYPPTGALRTGSVVDLLGKIARLQADLAQTYETLAEETRKALAEVATMSLTRVTVEPPREKPADLLRPAQVAKLLGCTPRTVRRMELDGRLPAPIGTGRMKRWRRADIERWLS